VGPASARHARTEARDPRGGETIFSLPGPPAGRSWRRRGRALWLLVGRCDQEGFRGQFARLFRLLEAKPRAERKTQRGKLNRDRFRAPVQAHPAALGAVRQSCGLRLIALPFIAASISKMRSFKRRTSARCACR